MSIAIHAHAATATLSLQLLLLLLAFALNVSPVRAAGAPDAASINLKSPTGTVRFGLDGDVNLWRSGAGELSTDSTINGVDLSAVKVTVDELQVTVDELSSASGPVSYPTESQIIIHPDWTGTEFVGFSGWAPAVCDGWAFIGAPWHKNGGSANQGAVFVYKQSGSTLSFVEKLTASVIGNSHNFGRALSCASGWLAVGTDGPAYMELFKLNASGTSWEFQQKMTSNGKYGNALDLSDDANYLCVTRKDQAISGKATAGDGHVYIRTGDTWAIQASFSATSGLHGHPGGACQGCSFGETCRLNADGSTIAFGEPHQVVGGAPSPSGAVHVYVRSGSTWSFQQKLDDSSLSAANNGIGIELALSGDTIASSHWSAAGDSWPNAGAVYVWTRTNNVWTLQQKVQPEAKWTFNNAHGNLASIGRGMTMHGDTLIIGARADQWSGTNTGAFFVLGRTGSSWVFLKRYQASDGASNRYFGGTMAMNNNMLLVGSHKPDPGKFYFYTGDFAAVATKSLPLRMDSINSKLEALQTALNGPWLDAELVANEVSNNAWMSGGQLGCRQRHGRVELIGQLHCLTGINCWDLADAAPVLIARLPVECRWDRHPASTTTPQLTNFIYQDDYRQFLVPSRHSAVQVKISYDGWVTVVNAGGVSGNYYLDFNAVSFAIAYRSGCSPDVNAYPCTSTQERSPYFATDGCKLCSYITPP